MLCGQAGQVTTAKQPFHNSHHLVSAPVTRDPPVRAVCRPSSSPIQRATRSYKQQYSRALTQLTVKNIRSDRIASDELGSTSLDAKVLQSVPIPQ